MRPGLVVSSVLLSVFLALAVVGPATSAQQGVAPPDGVEQVLILSLPTVGWSDLEGDYPALNALLDESAIADLSVRGVTRFTSASDAYMTIGAGTRTKGGIESRLAYPDGPSGEDAVAAAAFVRRTGVEPSPGEIFNLGIVSARRENSRLDFGAEIGALASALDEAGLARAVIGNGDHGLDRDEPMRVQRQVSAGLMDGEGIVSAGKVDDALLELDPASPYGVRSNLEAFEAAFADVWPDTDVVLVEAGDLARWNDYRSAVLPAQRAAMFDEAMAASDNLIGRLLDQVDLSTTAVVVVGPYHRGGDASLTIAALHAPGVEPGLLRSASTRRSGFVTLVDVAPTVLDQLGIPVPSAMEGRPFERGDSGGSVADRRAMLIAADEDAAFRDDQVTPAATYFVAAQVLLWILAAASLRWGAATHRRLVELVALAVLGLLPASYLATLLPFNELGSTAYWSFELVVGFALGAGCWLVGRRHVSDGLIAMLGVIFGLLAIDVVLGAPLQLNAVFGYSPTIAGRFAGFGNLAFGQLAAASIMLSGLLADRIGGRRGLVAGITVLAVAVILDGAPMWGSDVGGVLALVPAAGVTVWVLIGWRFRIRTALLWGGAAIVSVVGFGLLDLARPADERTHLGRLFESIGESGLEPLTTVMTRKLDANLSVLTNSIWTVMIPVVFAFIAYVYWRAPGALARIHERIPAERAALAGLLVVMVLGFAVNDSGIAVPGVMLGVVNASLVYLLLRVNETIADPWAAGDLPSPARPDERLDGEPDEGLERQPASPAVD